MNSQQILKYNPITGGILTNKLSPNYFRIFCGTGKWLYNPYTGKLRDPRDVESDELGYLITPV